MKIENKVFNPFFVWGFSWQLEMSDNISFKVNDSTKTIVILNVKRFSDINIMCPVSKSPVTIQYLFFAG